MKPTRIYLDTSVIGGYFDEEFLEPTRMLLQQIRDGRMVGVISTIVEQEIAGAPEQVRHLLERYSFEVLQETAEVVDLARSYLDENVVSAQHFNDCRHVAIASISHVTVLVSWNFKHIVQFERIRAFNAINLKCGYGLLDIRSPLEVIHRV